MKYIIFTTVIFFVLNLFPHDLYSQEVDLVKLKKQEEERKKKTKKSKHVLTNDNIDKIKGQEKPYAISKTGKIIKGSGQTNVITGSSSDSEMRKKQKKEYWQKKKKRLLDVIKRVEENINRTQEAFNLMLYDYRVEELRRITALSGLSKRIEMLKQKLENLKKELIELEDSARKDGCLPGWLREVEASPPPNVTGKKDN